MERKREANVYIQLAIARTCTDGGSTPSKTEIASGVLCIQFEMERKREANVYIQLAIAQTCTDGGSGGDMASQSFSFEPTYTGLQCMTEQLWRENKAETSCLFGWKN